jgi:hypothetical protein
MWRQKRFPNELARIAVLEKVSRALYLASQLVVSYGQKMSAPAIVQSALAFKKTTADAIKQATGSN